MRAERDDAIFDYFANPNASSLVDRSTMEVIFWFYFVFFSYLCCVGRRETNFNIHSGLQVEKFMKTWNENKEFREEYEQRKLAARNAQYPRNSSDA
jgi:hypothetical protein